MHFMGGIGFMPVDDHFEFGIGKRQVFIFFEMQHFHPQRGEPRPCKGEVRRVALRRAGVRGERPEFGEKFTTARPHIEQGLGRGFPVQLVEQKAGVAPL